MTLLTLSFTVCVLPWVYFFNKLGSTNAWKVGLIASFSGSGKLFLWLYRPTWPSASGLLYLHQDVLPYGHNLNSGFSSEDQLWQKLAHTDCCISSGFLFKKRITLVTFHYDIFIRKRLTFLLKKTFVTVTIISVMYNNGRITHQKLSRYFQSSS